MDKIAQIRAEIEKKIKVLSPFIHQGSDTCGKIIRQLETTTSASKANKLRKKLKDKIDTQIHVANSAGVGILSGAGVSTGSKAKGE